MKIKNENGEYKKSFILILSFTTILISLAISLKAVAYAMENAISILQEYETPPKVKYTSIAAENKNKPKAVFNLHDAYKNDGKKIAYLTFDDGPSKKVTPKILDILSSEKVKATFFVIGNLAEKNKDIIIREQKEGNTIGNHTYSHEYKKIYKDINAFKEEVNKTDSVLKNILGSSYNTKIFRFPGGMFGKKKEQFKTEIKSMNYQYINWNALSFDAEGRLKTSEQLLLNIKKTIKGKNHVVILMHDAAAKTTTAEALPQIIEYLKAQGYEFRTLSE